MSNAYATPDQLFVMYDRRAMLELSGDDNKHEGQPANIQLLLDMQASELESNISGMYTLPLSTVPAILTKWVIATTAARLFARRTDVPKGVKDDLEWAKDWIQGVRVGSLSIPGLCRSTQPALQDSDFKDGKSRWDWLWGCPSKTGPSKGT